MSNRDAAPASRPRNGGPRARIDWHAAFLFYASLDEPRTLRAVARQFGVSDTAVKKHAVAERWDERVAELHAEAARRAQARALRSFEERKLRTLLAIDKARDHLVDGDPEPPRWSDFPGLAKLELLIEGQATDRVEVAHVRRFALVLIERIEPLVAKENRQALLEAVEDAARELETGDAEAA